ncbi:MAG: hypothetical protein U0984_02090 [Prosthecobacter sp.]|nr:hypothetical protein [Prosthecobacter sp.]
MKYLVAAIAAFGLFSGLSQGAEALNTTCPVSNKPANPAITSTYTKTVALCCNKCKAQFTANPKGYLTNIIGANGAQCPLSRKKVDPAITVTYSRQVAFADPASKATFDARPDQHIRNVR